MIKKSLIGIAAALVLALPCLALAADPPATQTPVPEAQTQTPAAQTQTPESQTPPPVAEPEKVTPKIEKMEMPAGPPAELKKLAMLEGHWTTKSHTFESPMGPESNYTGKATYKWIFGGMHMEGDHDFHMAGKPERGRTTWGWSPEQKQYHLTWISSGYPSSRAHYGTFANDNTMVFYTTYMMQGKAITEKMTVAFSDPSNYTMTIESDMSGEMKPLVEETATRAKAAPKTASKASPAKKPAATTTKKTG